MRGYTVTRSAHMHMRMEAASGGSELACDVKKSIVFLRYLERRTGGWSGS